MQIQNSSDNSKVKYKGRGVRKTLTSIFRNKSLNRRFRRQIQRLIQKRKFLKAEQEILEL